MSWRPPRAAGAQKFSAKPVIVTPELQMIEKATILRVAAARGIPVVLPPTLRRAKEKPIRLIDVAGLVGLDGRYFASKKEGARYIELKLAERGGALTELQLQPAFKLHTTNPQGLKVQITDYHADFAYVQDGGRVVEECKGFPTPDWELRRKWVEAEYGIRILVT